MIGLCDTHARLQGKTQPIHPEFTADNAVVTAFDLYEQAAVRVTLYSSSFSLDSLPVFQEFQICSGGKTRSDSPVTLAGMSFGEFSGAAG